MSEIEAAESLRNIRRSQRVQINLVAVGNLPPQRVALPPIPIQPLLPILESKEEKEAKINAGQPRNLLKRKYTTHSDEQRTAIINMVISEGMQLNDIVSFFQGAVKRKYIQSLMRVFQKERRIFKKPKGGRQRTYTDEEIKYVAEIQNEHNEWTYRQIRDEWKLKFGNEKKMSNGTIFDALAKFDFSTKKLEMEHPQRNTPAAIEIRRAYCIDVSAFNQEEIVFIDEKGFNLHSHRGRGRSVKGKKAIISLPSTRGKFIAILGAISPTFGLMAYTVKIGYFNREEYAAFLNKLLAHHAFQRRTMRLIMDNCAIHQGNFIQHLIEEEQNVRHIRQLMPPYSPHLNAIEYMWAKWAIFVNTHEHNTQRSLLTLIDEAAANTTIQDCEGYYREVQRYYVLCAANHPLRYAAPHLPAPN